MKTSKGLSLQIAVAVAVTSLMGASAFAESRHSSRTGGSSHGFSRPSFSRSWGSHSAPRYESRGSRGSAPRGIAPRIAPGHAWRGGASRGPSFGRGYYNDGHRFYGQGRIERIRPYRGGYHIWLGGWGYPFFVPYRFYDPFRFRLGLFIGLNAFYDPLGYYDVYGWPGYAPPPVYSNDGRYDRYDRSDATLHGTVQSVDLRTGIIMITDDVSRRTVSALLPPRDNRVDDIRPGDYVEFSGEWVRGRSYEFDADRMDRFSRGR